MAAGLEVPTRRLRPRLAARRRREDVEVEAHGHRARADHRHVRLRRVPLLLPVGDHLRPGRLVLVGGPRGALPGRARQRLRQPRVARHRDGHPLLRRRRARGPASPARPTTRSARSSGGRRMPRGRPSSASRSTRRSRAVWELVDALNGYITSEEPWALAKDPAQRERLETVLATAYHGLGTLAVLLSPVLPEGDREAVDGARRRPAPCRSSASTARTSGPASATRVAAARGAVPAHRGRRSDGRPAPMTATPSRAEHLRTRTDGGRAVEYPPLPEPLAVARVRQPHAPRDRRRRDAARLPRAARARGIRRRARRRAGGHGRRDRAAGRPSVAAREPRMLAAVAIHPNEAPELEAAGALDDALAVIDELAARPRVRADRRDRARLLPHRRGRPRRPVPLVRGAHRHREAARRSPCRSTTATRTTRSSRRCAASARPSAPCSTASRATTSSPGSCADEGWYFSFAGNVDVQERREPARGAARRSRATCILVETDAPYLTPDAAPRPPERALPRAAHRCAFMAATLGRRPRRARARRSRRTPSACTAPWASTTARAGGAGRAARHARPACGTRRRRRASPRLLGPAEIRDLAELLDVTPTKKLGQNFVHDAQHRAPHRADRRRAARRDRARDRPGPRLAHPRPARGRAPVDRRRDRRAPRRAAAAHRVELMQPGPTLTVVHDDALRVTELPGEPVRLVANLPYNVSVPVLLHLLEHFPSHPRRASSWCRPRSGTGSPPSPARRSTAARA